MIDLISNTTDLFIIMMFGSIAIGYFMSAAYYLFVGNGE